MIGVVLERLGVPRWATILVLCAAAAAGALAYRAHLIGAGIAMEGARRDAIDHQRDAQAKAELDRVNALVRAAQAALDDALAHLAKLQSELSHEKERSTALQSDLAAGRRRMSVAVASACPAAAAEQGEGAAAAGVDPGGPVRVDLDGRAAADLEWLRQTRDGAITGLQACIVAYDAVKTAADAQEPGNAE